MQAAEWTILLRSQLCEHLPDHMKALISFNASMTWDNLLTSLDQSMPHVKAHAFASQNGVQSSVSFGMASNQVKSEPIDFNRIQTEESKRGSESFKGNCFYCKKSGHIISECFKKKNAKLQILYYSLLQLALVEQRTSGDRNARNGSSRLQTIYSNV